jgi:exopolysaccharide biosynthesis protein
MKKIIFISLLLCLVLAVEGQAVKLSKIRFGSFPDKMRAVFDFDSTFAYALDESKEKIIIHLPGAEAAAEIQNYIDLGDMIVRYFEVEKEEDGLKITIPLTQPVPYNVFQLNDPQRLVVDFDREFTNVVSGGTIIDGVEHLIVSKGNINGLVTAHVLKVDLNRADVTPALARKDKPNVLQSFVSLFNPWKETNSDKHFYLARVSTIAEEQQAVAAVNGTYFAYTGRPLGSLLIDRELVSSPIYDRTALMIDDNHETFIDTVLIDCYFVAVNGAKYAIGGVNQGRDPDAVVLYTPAWGERTGTESDGIELIVAGSVVREIKPGNANIPQDGFVISLNGAPARSIGDNVKVGDKIDLHIRVVPYATSPTSIRHMISGGPRLVKEGIVYVSKNEEKFKSDIARGRAARTAVGITKDNKLLLVTVDGLPRDKSARDERSSIGVTLEELAELMINLGAVEAMNLDGGGSSTMWIDGKVVNKPATGYEQAVSNALVITPRATN